MRKVTSGGVIPIVVAEGYALVVEVDEFCEALAQGGEVLSVNPGDLGVGNVGAVLKRGWESNGLRFLIHIGHAACENGDSLSGGGFAERAARCAVSEGGIDIV